ncbi:unnamed protein product, partial [Polarella glacialis]
MLFQELLNQALAEISRGHDAELRRVTEALRTENESLAHQLARVQKLLLSSASLVPVPSPPPTPSANPQPVSVRGLRKLASGPTAEPPEPPGLPPASELAEKGSPGESTTFDQQQTTWDQHPGRELLVPAGGPMRSLLVKPIEPQSPLILSHERPLGIHLVEMDLPGIVDQEEQGALDVLNASTVTADDNNSNSNSSLLPPSARGVQFEEPGSPYSLIKHRMSDLSLSSVTASQLQECLKNENFTLPPSETPALSLTAFETSAWQRSRSNEKSPPPSETPSQPVRARSKKSTSSLASPPPVEEAVQLQLVWKEERAPSKRSNSMRRISIGSKLTPTSGSFPPAHTPPDEDRSRCWRCLNSWVMRPDSNKQVAFEVVGLLLILYDLVWWPAQIFGFRAVSFTQPILWFSSVFWACDLLLSFFVGYTIHNQGLIEMRVSKIARHYARTWLPIDLPLVLIDWTLNALLLLRNHRVVDFGGEDFLDRVQNLRLLRLIRLFKATVFIRFLSDRIQSETNRILVRVLKLLVFIMLINHLIACSWYGVGISDSEREDTWVKANAVQEKGEVYAYTTALHWSITQFTPASMEVVPKNELERSFTIVVIVSAMVIFSSFISTITNAMNQLGNLGSERNAQLVKLRRFFSEQKVSASLVARISRCIHQSNKMASARVHSEDISILELLPVSLKCDLAEEIFAPTLCAHPFISTWAEYYPSESKRLFLAARSFSLGKKHELFHAGQATESMYFLSSGSMVFMRDDQVPQEIPDQVSPGQWLAEPAMWLTWKHVGHVSSTENCELMSLHCETAISCLTATGVDSAARRYAKVFAAYFAKNSLELSDVWADKDVLKAMVSTAFIKDEKDLLRLEVNTTGVKD